MPIKQVSPVVICRVEADVSDHVVTINSVLIGMFQPNGLVSSYVFLFLEKSIKIIVIP